jgi:integrase
MNLATVDVDAYQMLRAKSLRRTSLPDHSASVRCFLRFLNSTGRVARDLSPALITPRRYALESIPSSLPSKDVKTILEATSRDRSRSGLRDYAILMLLANYGLRAGEITALRLDDVDWRREVIRIRHCKTRAHSELPLLPIVGNAVLEYLRKGRPETHVRQVFIVHHAPYRAFSNGSSLYWLIRGRITAAGVNCQSKQGPHAFRHARAISMLRAGVPLKEIGDILGHRSSASTTAYLKLATEDLRAVALDIPGEVKHEPRQD